MKDSRQITMYSWSARNKIRRSGARFQTEGDDKDGKNAVSVYLFDDNRQIAPAIQPFAPPGHEWDDHTPQPEPNDSGFGGIPGWFSTTALNADATSERLRNFHLEVEKSVGQGWNFRYASAVWLEDNKTVIEFRHFAEVVRLRDDQPRTRKAFRRTSKISCARAFRGGGCSYVRCQASFKMSLPDFQKHSSVRSGASWRRCFAFQE